MDETSIAACQSLAEKYCNTGENGCRWYHGSWHLLKALGIVSTSAIHETNIARLLESAIEDHATPRILLAGSTDESLLRIVRKVCHGMSVDAEITALDICRTPLQFMQLYAHRKQFELKTVQADILEFDGADAFDVILTHAFMGYFDDVERQRLVRRWKTLLDTHGKIVTIQRVRPPDSPPIVRFSQQQGTDFLAAAVSAAEQHGISSGPALMRVEEAATRFARNFFSHSVNSKSSLERLFNDAGMIFSTLEYQSLGTRERLSGPSVPSGGEYAHIIASKELEDGP